MSTFLDGPAKDISLNLRRAPIVLRAVQSPSGWDGLDQPDDTPKGNEVVFVYILASMVWRALVRPGGCFAHGNYRYLPEQPPQYLTRNKEDWAEWCEINKERLMEIHRGFLAENKP